MLPTRRAKICAGVVHAWSEWLTPLLCLVLLSSASAADLAGKIDFNFQIRPILADKCFTCHGPDERTRKGKLRLDLPESALAIRDAQTGRKAVVPGHPEKSELYRRITSTDEDERMPPGSSKLSLDQQEKDLLRRWIEQGAEYKLHWAFIPVSEVAVPAVKEKSRTVNPIDSFVIRKLEEHSFSPAPAGTRETLIRRLSFDLRGLPPSLAEIDEFLADHSFGAYEKLVDRLLASPAYGERQANDWLDLARYADTYGYQADVEKDLSAWRDWVIAAFNSNLPYDEFITWQLAGDLLPEARREQILATAFNRLHRQTNEGGSIDEEFRTEYVADRVQTASTAFLGLTMGCARCHDHKYDPISQKDFYRMSAFFDKIDESGLYSHFTTATPTPTMLLYPDGAEARQRALAEQIRVAESELKSAEKAAIGRFEAWSQGNGVSDLPAPQPVSAYSFEQITSNAIPDSVSTNTIQMVDGPVLTEGKEGKAIQFSGDNSAVSKGAGNFDRTMPFSFGLWLKPGAQQERAVVFHRSRAWTDSGSRGYELVLEEGKPAFSLIHFWPGNAIKIRARESLALGEWSHLTVTYDGSSRASGMRLYLNGKNVDAEVIRDNLYRDILHRSEWGDGDVGSVELTLAGRFRDSGFKNGTVDEFKVFNRCLTRPEAARLAGTGMSAPSREDLLEYYLAAVDPLLAKSRDELQSLRREENKLINGVPEIMVMKEMEPLRHTYLLKRGAYDARGEEVQPGTPDHILPFPKEFPANRLGLARWMTDPRNPLTARVAVNRAWRQHFGRGIVVTEEDFGVQGRLPSHPELLEWLAHWFIASGWDVKALHKLIVLSATYRQSSVAKPEVLAADPENQWLARGPKHRLAAEQIRDNALAISGLLSTKIGGRSTKPYQPEGLWEEAGTGKHYEQDKGEGLYRRSLYTFWRRTAPPPSMTVFDAPSREVCTARRESTTTPLQALVLLNDPQFLEAARCLSETVVREFPSDLDARITRVFRLTTGRQPNVQERELLRQSFQEQRELFQADPKSAGKFLSVGARARDESLPEEDLAATATLVNTLMNLDEFVMKR